jgi:alpha-D-xyloside xylohydrolase
VFVPEGAIIPYGPAIEWTDEKPADVIKLYVYAGHDGQFTLYEDEGTNYNYEKGKYATIDFSYDDAKKQLTIGARKGAFEGMLNKRTFEIIYRTPQVSTSDLLLDDVKGKVVKYQGKAVSVKLK